MDQHQNSSASDLLRDLYHSFSIEVKNGPAQKKEHKSDHQSGSPKRYDDADDTPISDSLRDELTVLRQKQQTAKRAQTTAARKKNK